MAESEVGTCAICGAALDPLPQIRGNDLLHGVEGDFAVHVCRSCGAGNTRPRVPDSELGPTTRRAMGPTAKRPAHSPTGSGAWSLGAR